MPKKLSLQVPDCADCGMIVGANEYHPYAACLMFKSCKDGSVVRANLAAVKAVALREVEPKMYNLYLSADAGRDECMESVSYMILEEANNLDANTQNPTSLNN